MNNELWQARNDPQDGRIGELFDADETLWLLGFNAEPVVMESKTFEQTYQGFLFRFRVQKRDKTELVSFPIFFSAGMMQDLKKHVYEEFEGFGVSE